MNTKNRPFKIGDQVKWVCSPCKSPEFVAVGKIVELKKTTFAGQFKKMGARMEIAPGTRYRKIMKKNWAIVGTDKLERA